MKFIKTELHHVAYTERCISNRELIPTLLRLEKQIYTGGLYKNGPLMIETSFSDFGQQGNHLFKFYIPLNERIAEEGGFKYLKTLVLEKVVSHRVAFGGDIFYELDKLRQEMMELGLEHIDDKLYLTFYPVFNELWVDIHLPFEEK